MLGFNLKSISGYTDSGTLNLAMDRAEVEGRTGGLSSIKANKPDWLKPDGPMQVLMVFGRKTRFPDFPSAPTAGELAKTAKDKALIELLELPYALSRPFAAPPGVPPDRAKALQKAFMETHKDPDYLKEAAALSLDVSPIDGDEVLRLIDNIAKLPEEQLKSVEKLVAGSGG
jgi:tripartite-type tricarboxylate transporter receptor subunit TctC